jgi:hypothetical protein
MNQDQAVGRETVAGKRGKLGVNRCKSMMLTKCWGCEGCRNDINGDDNRNIDNDRNLYDDKMLRYIPV